MVITDRVGRIQQHDTCDGAIFGECIGIVSYMLCANRFYSFQHNVRVSENRGPQYSTLNSRIQVPPMTTFAIGKTERLEHRGFFPARSGGSYNHRCTHVKPFSVDAGSRRDATSKHLDLPSLLRERNCSNKPAGTGPKKACYHE